MKTAGPFHSKVRCKTVLHFKPPWPLILVVAPFLFLSPLPVRAVNEITADGSITTSTSFINVTTVNGIGLRALNNGQITYGSPTSAPAVILSANRAFGAVAESGGLIRLENAIIRGGGPNYTALRGIAAFNGGKIIANNTFVFTTPTSVGAAVALRVNTVGSEIEFNGGAVNTWAADAVTALVADGGLLTVTGNMAEQGVFVDFTASGTDAIALKIMGTAAETTTETANFTQAQVVSFAGATIHVEESNANIDFTDSIVGLNPNDGFGSGKLIEVFGGISDLTATRSHLFGSASLDNGAVSNMTLQDSSTWLMTADSTLTNLTNLASTVLFAREGDFKVLKLEGNLAGDRGIFTMNTNLGEREGDLLDIRGSSSGNYRILVTNTGGSPSGSGQALRLVQTTDGADGANFELANPQRRVQAGLFSYRLRLGNERGETDDPLAWYLVNDLGSGGRLVDGIAPDDLLSAEGQVVVNTVAALPGLWLKELETLNQRMGELRLSFDESQEAPAGKLVDGKKTVVPPEAVSPLWNAWIRTYGRRINAETDLGGRFGEYLWGIQLGVDRAYRLDDGIFWLGAFAGYSRADRDFREAGEGDTDSITAGIYGTWLTSSGWYVDAVAKVNRFDTDMKAIDDFGASSESGYRNWGYGVSVEVGRRFALSGDWFIEPQVQAAYTHLTSANFETSSGVGVDVGHEDVFELRAGVIVGKKLLCGGHKVQPYMRASVVDVLSHGGKVGSGGAELHSTLDGVRFEGGVGIMAQLGDRNQMYFDYTAAVGGNVDQPWGVNLGFRHMW